MHYLWRKSKSLLCKRAWETQHQIHKMAVLFIYLLLAAHGLSLVASSRGYSLLQRASFSLWSTGSRHTGFSSCGSWALERRLSSCGTQA